MKREEIRYTFLGMDSSDSLKEYAWEKISKREDLLKHATALEVAFKQSKAKKGVVNDFRVNISVDLPETPVRVEQRGEDMYANIDFAVDTLVRRLQRYTDRKARWSGEKAWEVQEGEPTLDDFDTDDYSDYVPRIVRRKRIEDISPLEEGEAIERMDMLGYDFFLFRNRRTDKISVVYRRKDGSYGIVEPS